MKRMKKTRQKTRQKNGKRIANEILFLILWQK